MKFMHLDKLSPQMKAAIVQQAASQREAAPQGQRSFQTRNMMRTIPHWSGSFTYQGTKYPYTMAGGSPVAGGTTRIETQLMPLNFVLDGCPDENGNPMRFGVKGVLSNT